LLQSQVVLELAADALGVSPVLLEEYTHTAVALPDSVVLQLNVRGPSPTLTADLANAIGAIGTRYTRQFHEMYELQQVDLAATNAEPISPDHVQNAVLSAILGIIFGVGSVLLREALVYVASLRPEQQPSSASLAPPGTVVAAKH
jgi:capsular polysaccharide biosynthesis protein